MNELALNDLIGPALDKAAEAAVSEVSSKLRDLRDAVSRYEDAVRSHARHRALTTMLAAIGQAPPEHLDDRETAAANLRSALDWLAPEVAILPTPLLPTPTLRSASLEESKQVEAPRSETPRSKANQGELNQSESMRVNAAHAAPPPTKTSLVEDPPSKETLKFCYGALREVGEFREKAPAMHELRSLPWLQAVVADLRDALRRLPGKHVMFQKLEGAIGFLGVMKREANQQGRGPKGFVKGLAYEDQFDEEASWAAIGRTCRAKMAQFDRDAEIADKIAMQKQAAAAQKEVSAAQKEAAAQKRAEKAKKTEETNGKSIEAADAIVVEPPPAWPNLRKTLLDLPVLVVGNVKKATERRDQIKRRVDVEAEWCVIDNDKGSNRQLDNVTARILSGKVGGVVILEGFVHHKVTKRIQGACFDALVPHSYGNKGGVGEMKDALSELDRKLGCIDRFSAPSADAMFSVMSAQMNGQASGSGRGG